MVSYSQSFAQLIFDINYNEASKSTRVGANLFGIFIPKFYWRLRDIYIEWISVARHFALCMKEHIIENIVVVFATKLLSVSLLNLTLLEVFYSVIS